MKHRTVFVPLPIAAWLAISLAVGLSASLAAGPLPTQPTGPLVPEGPWLRVDTPGFILLGDVPEDRLRRLAANLEKLRYTFLSVAGGDAVTLEGTTPTYVYALKDKSSILSIPGAGFFVPREHRNYAVVHAHPRVSPTGVLYREYIHQLLHTTATPYPLWLRQGLVELFGTAQVSEDGSSIHIGSPSSLMMVVKPGEFWPIEQLVSSEEVPDLESHYGSVFRYESWALTHYLLFGPKETDRWLPDFLAKVRAGDLPDEAFHEVFGSLLPGDLRAALLAYLERETLGVEVRRAEGLSNEERTQWDRFLTARANVGKVVWIQPMPAPELAVRPMDRVEVLFRLGDLLLEAVPDQQEKAARFLRRAVELDPDHGPAHLDLAVLAQRSGDPETALVHADKALEHLPADARLERSRANLVAGSAILDALGRRRPANPADSERLARAMATLRRATDLTPDNPHAWTELVLAYGLEPKPVPEELEVLTEAMERFPERVDLVSNALLAHGRRGDADTAEALYRRLQEMGADAATLTRGREVLLHLAFYQGDRLIYQGNTDDAIGLFARIQSQTTDPRLRQQVSDRIALLERAEEYNRFIDRLLDCQQRMTEGDLDGASELLSTLRETAHPGKQAEVVEELGDRLAGLRAENQGG